MELGVENIRTTQKGRILNFDIIVRPKKKPSSKILGFMEVHVEDNGRAYVGNTGVNEEFIGKKLGKALYEFAIAYYGELNTRFDEASTQAQRVWLSLINSGKYRYDWQEGTYLCIWPKGQRRRKRCFGNSS